MAQDDDERTGFAQIPRWLLHDEGVSAHAKLVYVVLSSHVSRRNRAWPSHRTIGTVSGLSKSTVIRALRELEALGVIVKRHRFAHGERQTSNEYELRSSL